jgi:hypothetical protein
MAPRRNENPWSRGDKSQVKSGMSSRPSPKNSRRQLRDSPTTGIQLVSTSQPVLTELHITQHAPAQTTAPTCVECEVGVGAGCLVHVHPALRPEGQGIRAPHRLQPVHNIGGVDDLGACRDHCAIWQHVPGHCILAILRRKKQATGVNGEGRASLQHRCSMLPIVASYCAEH